MPHFETMYSLRSALVLWQLAAVQPILSGTDTPSVWVLSSSYLRLTASPLSWRLLTVCPREVFSFQLRQHGSRRDSTHRIVELVARATEREDLRTSLLIR